MVCISLLVRRRGKRRAEEWRRGSHSTLVLAEKRSGGSEARVYSRDPFRDCAECCFEHRKTRSIYMF